MKKSTAVRGLAVVAAAATIAVNAAVPASAAYVSGSCSTGGFSATLYLDYTNTGTHHDVEGYSWVINGQDNSTKNNVHGKLRRVVGTGFQQLHSFARDDVHDGYDEHPADGLYPYSDRLYATMEFIFDRNNLPDPRCTATTSIL